MLDTMKIGLLRLDTRKEPPGYIRVVSKSDPDGPVNNYFRIPLHVAFDLEGYNTYKEYLKKENTELKTWVHDMYITLPPPPENAELYPKAGHEIFIGQLRELIEQSPDFPESLKSYVNNAIKDYVKAKKQPVQEYEEVDDEEPPMTAAEKVAAAKALTIYSVLQRSRFDPGRPNKSGEFAISPFVRGKRDKTARQVIEEVTEAVSHHVWRTPKVSKYSETEGVGLQIKLTKIFQECFYKEMIRFMRKKLNLADYLSQTQIRRKPRS